MKKLMTICLGGVLSVASLAGSGVVYMQTDHRDLRPKGARDVGTVPTVIYDQNTVTIESDSAVYDAHIVIKNVSGDVIHEEDAVLSPMRHTIYSPDTDCERKHKIEISYGKNILYGYFE